jgi:hypothetical protein
MDPNAAFDIVMDVDADREDRREAIENLRMWIANGGFPPDDMDPEDVMNLTGMDEDDYLDAMSIALKYRD